MADLNSLKQNVFDYVRLMLGDGMVDVELDSDHYNLALEQAFKIFRQHSNSAFEESYGFLTLVKDQQEYILDDNIMEVRQIFRRGVGSGTNGGVTQFEPFEAAFVNTYLLQAGRLGGLATYEMWAGYQELSARMFGGYINFYWEPVSKKLTLVRNIRAEGETVMLWLYNRKPDVTLLQDHLVLPWLQTYSLGLCKIMLGEARSKFSTIVGPGGGTSLNGDALKTEGKELLQECMDKIKLFQVGNTPLTFVIG